MYKVAKIFFKPLIDDEEEITDKICDILSMLYKNGQITKEWIVEKHNEKYIANVVTTDDDSLDSKYYNRYIRDEIVNFEIDSEIICDDAMASDTCHCKEHSYYIFAVDRYELSTPVICGDCGKEIPLIRVPYLYNEEEHYTILSFRKMYEAVDILWMDSLSDRFSKRQLTDHGSQLNKRGMDIRDELEKKTGKPVYYFLLNPIGGRFQAEKNNKDLELCPKCGKSFSKIDDPPTNVNKLCHPCRLAVISHTEDA